MRTLCHYVIKNWFSEHSFRSIIDPKIAEIGKFSRTNQQRKVLHEGKKTMNANRDIELFSGFFEQIKQNGMKNQSFQQSVGILPSWNASIDHVITTRINNSFCYQSLNCHCLTSVYTFTNISAKRKKKIIAFI